MRRAADCIRDLNGVMSPATFWRKQSDPNDPIPKIVKIGPHMSAIPLDAWTHYLENMGEIYAGLYDGDAA
ncbi:hypothetical protein [Ruegeria sp. HKCCD7221]|uniref:hypothetical protein n=1 Tax=Ruegeria sp. HKCCD7221 TaxID=2683009 RepID=UPI00148814B5|nr:hypothetical protein [Ruegeria sp. HKCCD7221]